MTATPRERLIQDIGDCFKGECAKVARGEKSTQADGERGVFSDASLADYLLSHGWRESGQAGELDTSTAAASDATVASAQPSVVSASPAPSLEAREPLSDAEVDRIGFKVEPEFRKLFDAFERCNGLEPERENLIRAVASALRGEG